jgi:CelD/BcsL family acetyltransferase involved in cellulose biosynthesis
VVGDKVLEIRITKDIDSFLALEDEWNRLISNRFDNHPFLSHFWYVNYYRAYYPKAPLWVLTAHEDDGTLACVLPMVLGNRRVAGIPLKEARLLAGAHSHLNRILVTPEDEGILELFLRKLFDSGADLAYFEDLPDDFPDPVRLKKLVNEEKLSLEVRTVRRSPFIPTTGSFEDYRANLSKKFRELLNNRLNRINRAGGFEIRTYRRPDEFDVMMKDMRLIAVKSWQGENNSGLFSGESNDHFYNNLIRHALANGYGRVFILYFDGKPTAFEFHVYAGTTEYCLKSEYSQEFNKISPGGVLDLELVKSAFNSNIEVYDLLGFEDSYKLRWTSHRKPYRRYFIFGRSMAARTAYMLYYRFGNRLRNMGFLRRIRERLRRR